MWHPLIPATRAQVLIGNQGNTSLALSFGLERRNDSVLAPIQWLDPAAGYQKLFMGLQGSCGDGQVQSPAQLSPAIVASPMARSRLAAKHRCYAVYR